MSHNESFDLKDSDNTRGLLWEDEAFDVVQYAIENASVDDVRGTVFFDSDFGHKFGHECQTFDELQEHLAEIYDEAWYSYVPFDGGQAVFESDPLGKVGDILAGSDFEDFFRQIRDPENASRILTSSELVRTAAKSQLLLLEFHDVGKELAEYFAKNPDELREIDPRVFEKLMAAIFGNRGFDVTLTPATRDGGVDLMLLKRTDIGAAMTLVQCKRNAEHHKVGVGVVRGLYGAVERERATSGLIVTTSFFTADAIAERKRIEHRMQLADFNNVKQFLEDWRH